MSKLCLFLFLAFAFASQLTAQPCQQEATRQAAAARILNGRLLAARGVREEPLGRMTPVLDAFKQSLITTADAAISCDRVNVSQLQSDLAGLLHANRPPKPEHALTEQDVDNMYKPAKGIYGADLRVTAKVISQPDTIAIDFNFGIDCGEDNVLLVYSHAPGGYRREITYLHREVGSISDAYGDILVYGGVPGPSDRQLIAVAHGLPSCTSRFSGFVVDLLQPATDSQPQKVVAQREYGYNRGDIPARLNPNSSGFTIRLSVPSKDLNVFEYPGIFRFITTSGKLERIPAASNARDFFEQWLDEDWPVADSWTDPAAPQAHETWNRLTYVKGKHEDVPTIEFREVRGCTDPHRFQVAMNLETVFNMSRKDEAKLFAFVRQNGATFTMMGFADKPDPQCHGALIMPAPKD